MTGVDEMNDIVSAIDERMRARSIAVPKEVCGERFTLDLQTREIACESGFRTSYDRLHHRKRKRLDGWMRDKGFQFK